MGKTVCAISRAEFNEQAKPVEIVVNGTTLIAEVKQFSTGSLGWYLNAKATLKIGDKNVPVQIGANLTIVGSKDLPPE